jgi:hypothetical protein
MNAIDYIARTGTIHIATELRSGPEVVTPIWGVVVDGVPYIRSAYGPGSRWYRRAQRAGHAVFVDGADRYPARIENLADEATNRKVDDAYRAKYAAQASAVREVTSPQARLFTMRVVPEPPA